LTLKNKRGVRAEAAVQKTDTARRRLEMATKPFAAAIVGEDTSAGDFIANVLQASTEYSTTSRSLDRAILRNVGRWCAGIFPRLPRYYGAGAPDRACQRAVSKSAAGDFLRNALMAATDARMMTESGSISCAAQGVL
jgi:hypothetical protein